jgi:hypothetical protein
MGTVPPEANLEFVGDHYLPMQPEPNNQPSDLFEDLGKVLTEFVDISAASVLLMRAQILASWYFREPNVTPYLWIVGPYASGKSTLLRILHRLCCQAAYVVDVRAGALLKLIEEGQTTLLFDEFDPSAARYRALYPLLRAGTMRGALVARNNVLASTFCPKIFSSRELPADAALSSRSLVVRMFRTEKMLRKLDEDALNEITAKFQPRLLQFRSNSRTLKGPGSLSAAKLDVLTPRTRDLAIALMTPLNDKPDIIKQILPIMKDHDDSLRVEQSLEPEWLTVEALFDLSHDERQDPSTVGGITAHLNFRLERRGESFKFNARRIGGILRSLGIETIPLGNIGRGIRFTRVVKKRIHQLASQFGIDRRAIALSGGVEAGYGGAPCRLCKKFGVMGALRFVNITPRRSPRKKKTKSRLFDPAYKDKIEKKENLS